MMKKLFMLLIFFIGFNLNYSLAQPETVEKTEYQEKRKKKIDKDHRSKVIKKRRALRNQKMRTKLKFMKRRALADGKINKRERKRLVRAKAQMKKRMKRMRTKRTVII